MTTNTPITSLDFSGFNLGSANAQVIRRSAEATRSLYLSAAFKQIGQRTKTAYHSTTELFSYAQRMNQAAKL